MAIGSDFYDFTIKTLTNNSLVLRQGPLLTGQLNVLYFNEEYYTK
jgi:hypothetical protein